MYQRQYELESFTISYRNFQSCLMVGLDSAVNKTNRKDVQGTYHHQLSSLEYHLAQPIEFLKQVNRNDFDIPVIWFMWNLDPTCQFKLSSYSF